MTSILTFEEMRELAIRRDNGDKEAIDLMFDSNKGLALSIARRFYGHVYFPFDDVLQEAYIGLYKAVLHWDYNRGVQFSSYATPSIKNHICRAFSEQNGLIRLPANKYRDVCIVRKYIREHKTGTFIPNSQISEGCDLSVKEVKECLDIHNTIREYKHAMPPEMQLYEDKSVEEKLQKEYILDLLDELPEREKSIIQYRFGFNENNECKTLDEVGAIFGVGRERVRQLQNRALKKLKLILDKRGLKFCDFYVG